MSLSFVEPNKPEKPNRRDRPNRPDVPDPRHAARNGFPYLLLFPRHNGSGSISLSQQDYGSVFFSQALRKGAMVSMGIGKMVVEFFSAAISTRVCR